MTEGAGAAFPLRLAAGEQGALAKDGRGIMVGHRNLCVRGKLVLVMCDSVRAGALRGSVSARTDTNARKSFPSFGAWTCGLGLVGGTESGLGLAGWDDERSGISKESS
jgi:hypothetical protein